VKDKAVCKGCKYHMAGTTYPELKGYCSYMDKTGHSRLKTELENGGYKKDSCICYEGKSSRQQSGGII